MEQTMSLVHVPTIFFLSEKFQNLPKDFQNQSAYGVMDACIFLKISRSTFYNWLKKQKIRSVIIANRRLIPATEIGRLVANNSS